MQRVFQTTVSSLNYSGEKTKFFQTLGTSFGSVSRALNHFRHGGERIETAFRIYQKARRQLSPSPFSSFLRLVLLNPFSEDQIKLHPASYMLKKLPSGLEPGKVVSIKKENRV